MLRLPKLLFPRDLTLCTGRTRTSLRYYSGGKSKSSKSWLSRQGRDPFVKQRSAASSDGGAVTGFRARSAFKLLEMIEQYPFILQGARVVVELGAAPGGWTEVVTKKFPLKPPRRRTVIAVDLLPMSPMAGVDIIRGDFLSPETQKQISDVIPQTSKVDVVLSDMSPNISGNRIRDIDHSLELCTMAFTFAKHRLASSEDTERAHCGVLVMKYFEHPELQAFRKDCLQPSFRSVHNVKPAASRSESSESYWVCSGFRGGLGAP